MCKSKIEILFFGGLLNKSHSVKFPTKVQGKWMGGLTFQDLTIMSIILHPFYDVYYSRLTNLIHFWDLAEISGKGEKKDLSHFGNFHPYVRRIRTRKY